MHEPDTPLHPEVRWTNKVMKMSNCTRERAVDLYHMMLRGLAMIRG